MHAPRVALTGLAICTSAATPSSSLAAPTWSVHSTESRKSPVASPHQRPSGGQDDPGRRLLPGSRPTRSAWQQPKRSGPRVGVHPSAGSENRERSASIGRPPLCLLETRKRRLASTRCLQRFAMPADRSPPKGFVFLTGSASQPATGSGSLASRNSNPFIDTVYSPDAASWRRIRSGTTHSVRRRVVT